MVDVDGGTGEDMVDVDGGSEVNYFPFSTSNDLLVVSVGLTSIYIKELF